METEENGCKRTRESTVLVHRCECEVQAMWLRINIDPKSNVKLHYNQVTFHVVSVVRSRSLFFHSFASVALLLSISRSVSLSLAFVRLPALSACISRYACSNFFLFRVNIRNSTISLLLLLLLLCVCVECQALEFANRYDHKKCVVTMHTEEMPRTFSER